MQYARSEATKLGILKAAEDLFAAAGFDRVSVRDVARKANVPLGLIHYHFTSKEKLFEAIIARRSNELTERRNAAFARLGPAPELRDVVSVFFRPYLDLILGGDRGWRSYGMLLAQTGQQRRWAPLITRHFHDTQELMLAALVQAEPRLTPEAAARGYVHMVSVMFGIFSGNDLLGFVSNRVYSNRNFSRAYEFALPFIEGAFEGLAREVELSASKTPRSNRTKGRRSARG